MKNISIYLLMALILLSCENNRQNDYAEDKVSAPQIQSPAPMQEEVSDESGNVSTTLYKDASSDNNGSSPKTDLPAPTVEKKLIKNGSMRIQVEDYARTKPKINQLIAKYKGYIGSENETNMGTLLQNNITIRVPFPAYDALVAELEKEAKYVESKSVSVQDVTAQFVDLEARLKTRREVEARYMEFLKKAKNIDETLKIEEQIRLLREEIESAEGQLKLLRDQVQYSTLQLDVYQNLPYKIEPVPQNGFFSKMAEAFLKGWRIMLDFIVGLMYLWPFLIIITVVLYLLRRKIRKTNIKAVKPEERSKN